MNKFDLLQLYTNPQPVPAVYNEGFSQYESIKYLIGLINQLIGSNNLGADEIEDLKQKKVDLTYYLDDLTNKRKLSPDGNFTGKWFGLEMQESDAGLATDILNAKGTFNTLTEKINNIDASIQDNINQHDFLSQLKLKFVYGAIGDGNTHPLSEKYSTLADAQIKYPFADSLTNEIDYCALQSAINTETLIDIFKGTFITNKTINVPIGAKKIVGQGYYGTIGGTVIKYRGINDTPIFVVKEGNILQDFSVKKDNTSTGIKGFDCSGINAGDSRIHFELKNLYADSCDIGFSFAFAYYNLIQNCVAFSCGVGFSLGSECNANPFNGIHSNSCGIGLQVTAPNSANKFDGCSFEGSTIVGVDLSFNKTLSDCARDYTFDSCYFEGNKQTAWISGYCNEFNNCFVNHDWINSDKLTLGAVEIFRALGFKMTGTFFSGDITVANRIVMSAIIDDTNYSLHYPKGLTIDRNHTGEELANLLYNNNGLIKYGIINDNCFVTIKSEIIKSTSSANDLNSYFVMKGDYRLNGYHLVGVILRVYDSITGLATTPLTIRAGKANPFNDLVEQVYNTDLVAGIYYLPLKVFHGFFPNTYNYRFFNTAITVGKYDMEFILA